MTRRDQLQEISCNRLFWHTAARDDAKAADHLFHRREMDVVYAMDKATLFDSFFNYLREIDVFPLLEQLDSQKQKRKNVPFIQLLLVFVMKIISSIKTIDKINDMLLTDELLMSMCGFNIERTARKNVQARDKGLDNFMPNRKAVRNPRAENMLKAFEYVVRGHMALPDGTSCGFVSELTPLQREILKILEVPVHFFSYDYLFDTS